MDYIRCIYCTFHLLIIHYVSLSYLVFVDIYLHIWFIFIHIHICMLLWLTYSIYCDSQLIAKHTASSCANCPSEHISFKNADVSKHFEARIPLMHVDMMQALKWICPSFNFLQSQTVPKVLESYAWTMAQRPRCNGEINGMHPENAFSLPVTGTTIYRLKNLVNHRE